MKRNDPQARLHRAATALDLPLREAETRRLLSLEELLRRRAIPMGLVAEGDDASVLERHIIDSLRAAAVVDPDDGAAMDLGSGAGLPGLVVAVARPSLRVRLIEPKRRRVAFLELAIEHLALGNVDVLQVRAEEASGRVDLCFARALAPLARSWALARPLLRPGGRLIYFSGPVEEPPPVPPDGGSIELVEGRWVDSSGPLVMITRP